MINHALDNLLETWEILISHYFGLENHWQLYGSLFVVGFCCGGFLAFEFSRTELLCFGVVSVYGQPDTKLYQKH
ncbi:hypothetical protein Xbed_00288 [Xenorhabdus beddingii]|uniref:Dienelactone hydrolase domain-containing protein n=1 Tax=Xenorhabdus beddingii TaxID=40578 RepID=A0A1Y2SQZ6_9GAMM|nr:dienelactone hydrolase family protein [Xenorhabdus beddingii]OTA21542.1 hypothetical protein Xbed_00288 [Xenorhabdus beddingii]